MSDFLARLAARAVGTASARPLLPALFEEPGRSTDGAAEVSDETLSPSSSAAASSARASTGHIPDSARANGSTEGGESVLTPESLKPRSRVEEAEGKTTPRPITEPARVRARATAVTPFPGGERAAMGGETTSTVATEHETRASPGDGDGAAVLLVPAAPAASTRPDVGPRGAAGRETDAIVHEDRTTVRVHIGRLEVRANLHDAAHQQPRRETREPEGLSLSDYLRGKREVGG